MFSVSNKAYLTDLCSRREKSPITTRAIQMHAKLHKAIRRATLWAMEQAVIFPIEQRNTNNVFRFLSPDYTKTAAFLKTGIMDDAAVGTMELLMWNIAVFMGEEEHFVPTGKTEIRCAGKIMKWNASGELEAIETVRGSIQVAQQGQTLYDYVFAPVIWGLRKEKVIPPREEIIKGVFTSLWVETMDGHLDNFFVTHLGKIIFFDNSKNFPNSDGFINCGCEDGVDIIKSAYCCALLDFSVSGELLKDNELDNLKKGVDNLSAKIDELIKYLYSSQVQNQLKQLPPGWMNLEGAIQALVKRVTLMKRALDQNKVKTLQDLVIRSLPDYKLAYALTYLIEIIEKKSFYIKCLHTKVNHTEMVYAMGRVTAQGIDCVLVKQWCDDPNISFSELEEKIKGHYIKSANITAEERDRRDKGNASVFGYISERAAFDYKDMDSLTCEILVRENNEKLFYRICRRQVCYRDPISEEVLQALRNKTIAFVITENDRYEIKVVYSVRNVIVSQDIDIKSSHGMVRVSEKEIPIANFINHYSSLARK